MNVSRFVSFASAVVLSAIQWTALSAGPSARPVAVSEASLPVVVVTAHRLS
jgi:hypothetical protein